MTFRAIQSANIYYAVEADKPFAAVPDGSLVIIFDPTGKTIIGEETYDAVLAEWIPRGVTADSANVRPIIGPRTQPRRRDKEIITGLVKVAEWPAGANIQEITIKCRFDSTTAPITADALAALSHLHGRFVIDPSTDALAALYAQLQNSVVDDSQFDTVDISMPGKSIATTFTLSGDKNAAGDIIRNGSLGGGVIYAMASDGATGLNFEVKGH